MLWLRGVSIMSAMALLFAVGFVIAVFNDQFNWVVVCGVAVLVFAIPAGLRIRQLKHHEESYNRVKIFCLQESPNVWSTHVGGFVVEIPKQFLQRLMEVLGGGSGRRLGMKLVLSQSDRQEVRRRSLACFETKLDQLSSVKNAVLITASVLNDPARNSGRLAERIRVLDKRPQWIYMLIERQLSICDAINGRVLYGWEFQKGNKFWRPYVPGLIAWRKDDNKPDLRQFDAKPAQIGQVGFID
ncbi:MAG TPA: hypothetical protein DIS96_14555 [Pusillimonas sp.]|nr:hypothetical protein [Pusillimonas sp.]